MPIKIGDTVKFNGKYADLPKDGKAHNVIHIGYVCNELCIWLDDKIDCVAYDSVDLVESEEE